MMTQKINEVFDCITKRSALALQIYGLESEQYLAFLEEEVLFQKDMN
jgi:hypothetical protein